MSEILSPVRPVASLWKASRYELQGGSDTSLADYVAAASGASWSRVDPFESYGPTDFARQSEKEDVRHVLFLRMKSSYEGRVPWKTFDRAVKLFAGRHGLLGLFSETFAAPVLPSRVDRYAWYLAPDTVVDSSGKMRAIDPSTEGKQRLESLLGPHPQTGESMIISPDGLVLPHELRFPSVGFTPFGLLPSPLGAQQAETFSWEQVRKLYGIRVLLDESVEPLRVALVATREPILYWRGELKGFPFPPVRAEVLNSRLERATPHGTTTADGDFRAGWRCPSLLKAMYLMLYLDQEAGNKILKCQAPDCPDYFRVGPTSRRTTYCPPPPGKKQSKCGSRSTSADYRKRQQQADTN